MTPDQRNQILAIAERSAIAKYSWKNRGVAPLGYTKGMALAFALELERLGQNDPAAQIMAGPNRHTNADALTWYATEFADKGMNNSKLGADTLRHLFALMLGLGMRESSGRYIEGRDMSASNTSSDTAEAGAFQQSWDSSYAAPSTIHELLRIYSETQDRPSLRDVFSEGVRGAIGSSYGSGVGLTFQRTAKLAPAFAVEACAVGLRMIRTHWGPINRKEAELRTDADEMLKAVQAIMEGTAPTPPVAEHDAKWLQAELNRRGVTPPLTVDGDVGPATVRAMIQFLSSLGPSA